MDWIGAAELERRRRAVGFRVVGVNRDVRGDLVGRTGHRVEALELVAAVEERILAGLVLEIELRKIEPAACRNRQPVRYIESIGGVQPRVGIPRVQTSQALAFVRIVDEDSRPLCQQGVWIHHPELAARRELRVAMIDAGADDEMVVVFEHLVRAGELGGAAESVGGNPVAVDFAQDRSAEGVRRCHTPDDTVCQRVGSVIKAQVDTVIAGRCVGAVAVVVALPEPAVIHVALERQSIREVVGQVRLQERELKVRVLRTRPHARPALIEQVDRRGCDVRENVVGAGEADVEFGLVVAGADVCIHAVEVRR